MISPSSSDARATARRVLPEAVGPRMVRRLKGRCDVNGNGILAEFARLGKFYKMIIINGVLMWFETGMITAVSTAGSPLLRFVEYFAINL
jgi:hypothetical protein